jgi:DNA primase large subunit
VLKSLEAGRARGLKGGEWSEHVKKALSKTVIQRHPQIDKIGHHILRLAFCKTEENRRWFVTQETQLFRFVSPTPTD